MAEFAFQVGELSGLVVESVLRLVVRVGGPLCLNTVLAVRLCRLCGRCRVPTGSGGQEGIDIVRLQDKSDALFHWLFLVNNLNPVEAFLVDEVPDPSVGSEKVCDS